MIYTRKIIAIILLVSFSFSNLFLSIDQALATSVGAGTAGGTSQAQTFTSGVQENNNLEQRVQDIAAQGVETIAVCGAGSLLASIIANGITTLLSVLGESVAESKLDPFKTVSVPITEVGTPRIESKLKASKEVMITFMGIPIAPSWDALAWCIVNEIIRYITEATIIWANSGFNGKPAFLENPEGFFRELADMEASSFIEQIAYNTTGVNVCEPFRIEIAARLANQYGRGLDPRRLSCGLDAIGENLSNVQVGFGVANNGGFTLENYWPQWNVFRNPANNGWGASILASNILYGSVQVRDNTARFEIGMNDGWLNFKKCSDPNDPASCKTTTPGKLIESSLNQSLGMGKQRLIMADEFDEMITAVVNNLIRVALNKVLEEVVE